MAPAPGWGQVTNWPNLFAFGIFCGGTVGGIRWATDIDVAIMDKVKV